MNPSNQRRTHRLVQVQMLGSGLFFDLPPHRRWQSDRADHRLSALPLAGVSPPKKESARAYLRHFPKSEQRRAPSLTGAGKGVPTYWPESLEVHLTFERVSHFHSVSFHSWSPFARL